MHHPIISWVTASQRRVIVVALLLLILVAYIDWVTGPLVDMDCFYLIPMFLFTWYLGKSAGFLVAIIYAMVWFCMDLQDVTIPPWPVVIWNGAVRCVTFIAIAWLVNLSKVLTGQVEQLVSARTAEMALSLQKQKEAEEAIHVLTGELSAAEDDARRKLGQDVHDTLGQNMSVLQLQLEYVMQHLPPDAAIKSRLGGALNLLGTMVQLTRTLTFELYPSMLDDLGLGPTLRRLAEQLQSQTASSISVVEADTPRGIPPPLRAFLFRATKELVTNSIKHGKAEEILVTIRHREGGIRVVVDDDGLGFDPATALAAHRNMGLGLAVIKERLRSFGGRLQIESNPGQGARVLLDVPQT